MIYRVSFEFRLTRRTIWSKDGSDFYEHVEQVTDKLEAHESASNVRAITHLADSSLTFEFQLESTGSGFVTNEALGIVRDAIEACGARHFGMASAARAQLVPAGAGSGMDTPIWHKQRMLVDIAA